jgi:hypothetical protein
MAQVFLDAPPEQLRAHFTLPALAVTVHHRAPDHPHNPDPGTPYPSAPGELHDPTSGGVHDRAPDHPRDPDPGNVHDPASGDVHDPASGELHDSAPGDARGPGPGEQHDPASSDPRGPASGELHDSASGDSRGPGPGELHDPAPGDARGPASGEQHDSASSDARGPASGELHDPASGDSCGPGPGEPHDPASGVLHGPGLDDIPAGCARTVFGALIPVRLLPGRGDPRRRELVFDGQRGTMDGVAVDRDPSARLASPGQRGFLAWRDRHCRFPGCDRPVTFALHAHHLTPYAQGGQTRVANLTLYCSQHHTLVHHG